MSHHYAAFSWSLTLASGWSVETHEETASGETTSHLIIVPAAHDATLRLTPDERFLVGTAQWVESFGRVNRAQGRRVTFAQCGDFLGNNVEFSTDDEWLRGWVLCAEDVALCACYRCELGNAGCDDQVVDVMLNSLRLEK